MKDFKPAEFHDPELQKQMDATITEMVRRQNLAIENLTRKQVEQVISQLFKSGDIIVQVAHDSNAQQVSYLPYRRVQELEAEIERLTNQIDGSTSLDA
jgi:protein-tyrosine-phosphatase